MFDRDALYNVLDSHFVSHLIREGEDISAGQGSFAEAGADSSDSGGDFSEDMPDNMLEDLLDELDDALADLHDDYDYASDALGAAAIGFIDGVLAQSSDSYASFEDAYFTDAKNAAYASADAAISDWASQFGGNRDWGEAALGYLRHVTGGDDGSADAADVADLDNVVWQAQAQGFIYGADLSEDYEWKVIQAPNDCILVTDEDALGEFSMRQLEKSGGGGLFERVQRIGN